MPEVRRRVPISGQTTDGHPLGPRLKASPGTLRQQHVHHVVRAGVLRLVAHEHRLVDVEVQDEARLHHYVLLVQAPPALPLGNIPADTHIGLLSMTVLRGIS